MSSCWVSCWCAWLRYAVSYWACSWSVMLWRVRPRGGVCGWFRWGFGWVSGWRVLYQCRVRLVRVRRRGSIGVWWGVVFCWMRSRPSSAATAAMSPRNAAKRNASMAPTPVKRLLSSPSVMMRLDSRVLCSMRGPFASGFAAQGITFGCRVSVVLRVLVVRRGCGFGG